MASIVWSWAEFWSWFESIESSQNKTLILRQIDANFIRGISYERQIEMFLYAPLEILGHIKHLLKPEAFALLEREKMKRLTKRSKQK